MKKLAARRRIADWYWVQELAQDVLWIREPGHCSFYLLKSGTTAALIDSGLGLSRELASRLLYDLGIKSFKVLNTHAHCDHIGLNSFASSAAISKLEWEKFNAQNEMTQFSRYIELVKGQIDLPRFHDGIRAEWQPDIFVVDGEEISIGFFNLKVIEAPGHTCGSLIFHDATNGLLFLGDLIYTGALYLHFKDSNFSHYEASIFRLIRLIEEQVTAPTLLPSHNSIPLDVEFVYEVQHVLKLIRSRTLLPSSAVPADTMFEEGIRFESGRVKIILRKDEYESLDT